MLSFHAILTNPWPRLAETSLRWKVLREKRDVASKGSKGKSGPEGCPRPPQRNSSFSPRSDEASHPVISVHPVNSYSSPDSLPPGGFLSLPDKQVSFNASWSS